MRRVYNLGILLFGIVATGWIFSTVGLATLAARRSWRSDSVLGPRSTLSGIQEWLSFYFKSPMARPDLQPEHDLFVQHLKLTNTLRILIGEEVLDHSGLDYYEQGRR